MGVIPGRRQSPRRPPDPYAAQARERRSVATEGKVTTQGYGLVARTERCADDSEKPRQA